MKKITFLLVSIIYITGYSQNAQLQELLDRYESIPSDGSTPLNYFSNEELVILKAYLNTDTNQSSTNRGSGIPMYGPNSDAGDFITFNTDTPQTLTIIGSDSGTADFESSGDIDPTDLDKAYVLTLSNGELYEVDITTAIYTSLGTITPPAGQDWNGLEFDPSTNLLYGISSNFSDTSTLSLIDIDAMTHTEIGDTGTSGAISIVTDGTGNFYMHDVISDSFYSVDSSTGAATLIGLIGFNSNFGQDLEWDNVTGTLFMTAFNNDTFNAELRVVDITTGNTTFIGNLGNGADAQIPWAAAQIESTLSTDGFSLSEVSIYPNPSANIIMVKSRLPLDTITLFNSLGQKVYAMQNNFNNELTIDISSLSSGIYLLETTFNGQKNIQKVLKQ